MTQLIQMYDNSVMKKVLQFKATGTWKHGRWADSVWLDFLTINNNKIEDKQEVIMEKSSKEFINPHEAVWLIMMMKRANHKVVTFYSQPFDWLHT